MSGAGRFDIRVPIGGLFLLLGIILTVYGLLTAHDSQMYAASQGILINFWWGLAMTIFGAAMLHFGRRAMKVTGTASASVREKEDDPSRTQG